MSAALDDFAELVDVLRAGGDGWADNFVDREYEQAERIALAAAAEAWPLIERFMSLRPTTRQEFGASPEGKAMLAELQSVIRYIESINHAQPVQTS